MIIRSPLVAVAIALLLVSCASAAAPSSSSASPEATPSVQPSEAASETPPSLSPVTSSPMKGGVLISGTLGYDGIEGGCPYVETDDGTRYQVLYPDGYAIDPSSGNLVRPDGDVAVPLGGELQLRGALQTEMASICQIGPIFQALEVIAS